MSDRTKTGQPRLHKRGSVYYLRAAVPTYVQDHTWSVRLEGMRLQFDDETYNLGAMANGVQNPTKRFDHNFDVFRFATNVRF